MPKFNSVSLLDSVRSHDPWPKGAVIYFMAREDKHNKK